jgi:hypothetical protein
MDKNTSHLNTTPLDDIIQWAASVGMDCGFDPFEISISPHGSDRPLLKLYWRPMDNGSIEITEAAFYKN